MAIALHRMWINQPSTHQNLHHLHGTRVLAHKDGAGYAQAFFLEGAIHSQRLPVGWLSPGWPTWAN